MKRIFDLRMMLLVVAVLCVAGMGAGCAKHPPKKAAAEPAQSERYQSDFELADTEAIDGIEAVEKNDLKGGMEHLQKALKYNPDHPRALCATGTVYRMQGKFDDAIKMCRKALAVQPDYVVCQDNLGLAYSSKGDFAAAEKSFLKAVSLDATYANANFNLGMLYLEKLGNVAKGKEYLNKYITLSKDQAKIQEVRTILSKM